MAIDGREAQFIRNDFKIGDRVENSYGARGKVTSIDGPVVVTYADRGCTWTGKYDDKWFKTYPGMLRKLREAVA
jgi:hypothetical protein